jgi:hypothetical protein
MHKLCLLAAFAALAVSASAGDGDRTQNVTPGIDTMPPVITATSLPCGVREFTATELRNNPNPPKPTPGEKDQVESGIQRIRLALDPSATNVSLTLITTQTFPKDNPVFSCTFQVALKDPSKPGSCVIEVLDWKNNLTQQQINIAAAAPAISVSSVNVGLVKVGNAGQGTVKITNNGDGPMILTNVSLRTGSRFAITAGNNVPVNVAPNGGTHDVAFSYTPTLASENGDDDLLTVETACGNVTCALSGKGGVSRIVVEDWNAGEVAADVTKCKPDPGLLIQNTGNVDLTITNLQISDPKFTLSTPTVPALPFTIPAGGSQSVGQLCYKSSTLGNASATMTITSDATDATDNVANLTASTSTSVEDEIGQIARVWFDAANSQIVFSQVQPSTVVTVVDLQGRVLATQVAEGSSLRINASAWTGVVMVSFTDESGVNSRTISVR